MYLLIKLYIWWTNDGSGVELRGTKTDSEIWKLLNY